MKRLPTDALIVAAIGSVAVVLALSLGDDYGQSWDEGAMSQLGTATILSYATRAPLQSLPGDLAAYGPSFAATSTWMTSVFTSLSPRLAQPDARHVSYFFAFLIAQISVYAISRGFVAPRPAVAAAILFATQPLLFGHAFINPKDMPFLAFFAASMALGMLASRALPPESISLPLNSPAYRRIGHRFFKSSFHAWAQTRQTVRKAYVGFLALSVAVATELLISHSLVLPLIHTTIRQAHGGHALPIIQSQFNRLATNAARIPVEDYLHKADVIYQWASTLTIVLIVFVAVGCALIVFRRPISVTISQLRSAPSGIGSTKAVLVKEAPTAVNHSFALLLLAAAAILGFTTAIRPVAPLAGALVTFLLVLRVRGWRSRAIIVAAYWLIAAMLAYLSWPFLWGAPISRFLLAYRTMMHYPWLGAELFRGLAFTVHELPRYYAPFHFLVQTTLPAVALGIAGGMIAIVRPRSLYHLAEVTVLCAWIAIPIFFAVGFQTPLYDSARQLLFSLTPLFIMSAFTIRWLAAKVHSYAFRLVFTVLMITPGIIAIVRLHPYEYIYYNELVGGVHGANREYELDYWGTSYRHAMEYLARTAPLRARIAVPWFPDSAWPYAREDFVLWHTYDAQSGELPDFVILTTRGLTADAYWPTAPTYYIVQREGAPLTIVRDLRGLPPQVPP